VRALNWLFRRVTKEADPEWWPATKQEFFDIGDKDKNGQIDLSEFVTLNEAWNTGVPNEKVHQAYEWAKSHSKHGKVDFEAFQQLLILWGSSENPEPEVQILFPFLHTPPPPANKQQQQPQQQQQTTTDTEYGKRYHAYFKVLDINGNGFISPSDGAQAGTHLAQALGQTDAAFTHTVHTFRDYIHHLVKFSDTNKDGKLSFPEFANHLNWLFRRETKEADPDWWPPTKKAFFDIGDSNKSGDIDLSEFEKVNEEFRTGVPKEKVHNAYEWAKHHSKQGKVDFEAFNQLLHIWGTSEAPEPELQILFPFLHTPFPAGVGPK